MSAGMTIEARSVTGCTYRELDYWTRRGHIRAEFGRGSGESRVWSDSELRVASMIKRLRTAGLPLELAADLAQQHEKHARGGPSYTEYELGDNITLAIRYNIEGVTC